MSVLSRIAHFQGRNDEMPNQELARELAERKDREGIAEIAENLWNKEKAVQCDCIKVMYEVGYLDPELIVEYANDFVQLLNSRSNRLVWGGMIALSTIASRTAEQLEIYAPEIKRAMSEGSVITIDNGVKTLAAIAASDPDRNRKVFPFLLQHLSECRPKDVPQYAESALMAVTAGNKGEFIEALEKRLPDLTRPQKKRVQAAIGEAGQRSE
jgi:hypothetical protein